MRLSHQRMTVFSVGVALSLACAGVPTGDGECPPMSYDATKQQELLSAWEGTYHIANWCGVGDCPPGEPKTHQFIVDPQNRSMTWTDGTTVVRELDLSVGCLTGIGTTTNDLPGGHSFHGSYTAPNEEETTFQIGCRSPDATARFYECMMTIGWEDPLTTQTDFGLVNADGNLKMFQGMFGINEQDRTIADFPGGSMAAERSRSLDSEYKSEIWILDP